MKPSLLLVVVALLCLVVAALVLAAGGHAPVLFRGGAPPPSPHIVVDALNLARGDGGDLAAVVAATASPLRERWPGRVMYVTKDRDTARGGKNRHAEYAALAAEHRVYIYSVEQYEDPPASSAEVAAAVAAAEHASRGRDDYYMAVLASRWKCPVLTADRLRDFAAFRTSIPPFQVYEFSFARALPERDFVRPGAAPVRRPRTLTPARVLGPAVAAKLGLESARNRIHSSSSSPSSSSSSPSSSSK
jgi:hypothetical protein